MANKKIKQTINLTGLSIGDIAKMTKSEFNVYSESSQRKIVSRLVSAYNKRIRYLGKSEIGKMSPTYKAYEERKREGQTGFISIKGKSQETISDMFTSLNKSLSSESTTTTGFKKMRSDLYERLGINFKELSKQDYLSQISDILGRDISKVGKKELNELKTLGYTTKELKQLSRDLAIKTEQQFWELYHKYEEYDRDYQNWSKGRSDEIINYIANDIDFQNISLKDLKTTLENKYKSLKEQSKIGQREDVFFEEKGTRK